MKILKEKKSGELSNRIEWCTIIINISIIKS